MTISSEIDERTLRELYLVPFEAAVREADVRVVMSGYNRLNGTFCSEHHWLLTELLRGEWGFDGARRQRLVRHAQRGGVGARRSRRRDARPASRARRAPARRGRTRRGPCATTSTGSWRECWRSPSGPAPADTATAETTADDPETQVGHPPRDGTGDGAAEERRWRAATGGDGAPGRPDRPVRPLRPPAGRRAARGCTPNHGRGPLEALQARGLDVTFEPGGSIAKYLPTVRGDFTVELRRRLRGDGADGGQPAGVVLGQAAGRGDRRARSFSARIAGTFVPDVTGTWELGVRAVGPAHVALDGETVVELTESLRGGAFFGMGSPEVRGTVELEEGRRYELTVDYPVTPTTSSSAASSSAPAPCRPTTPSPGRRPSPTSADVAIVIVGTDDDWETEGEDRTSLALPGDAGRAGRGRRWRRTRTRSSCSTPAHR